METKLFLDHLMDLWILSEIFQINFSIKFLFHLSFYLNALQFDYIFYFFYFSLILNILSDTKKKLFQNIFRRH